MQQKSLKRIICSIIISTLLITTLTSIALANEDELDPEVYDIDSLEAGITDRETNMQLRFDHEPNAIIIKFHPRSMFSGKEHQYDQAVDQVLRWGFRYESIDGLDNSYVVYSEEFDKNPNAVMNRFKNNRFIEYVEPNFILYPDNAPSDPNYRTSGRTYANYINAEAGWAIISDSRVPVAIIDSGYSGNADLPPANGWNILNKNPNISDTNGHGTRVAGTLGAMANNGIGNIGVVWNANLIPVKVFEGAGATAANLANGIIWAADNGARIINISMATPSNSVTLRNAIDHAFGKGCLIVASTGNTGSSPVHFPAGYPNVLGVGGTGNGTTRWSGSNFGDGLDVIASWSWTTTSNANGVSVSGGTSIAAPQVAGLAALIWELAPHLSNVQVMQLIRDNTNRADGRWDSQTGFGTIDMGKTLAAAQALSGGAADDPVAVDTTPPVLTLLGETTINLTEGDTYVEPGFTAIDDVDGDITHLVTVSGEVATAFTGRYTLTYTVFDQAGNTATATRTIEVAAIPAANTPTPERTPPTISQIGSNPIILHLGGSAYVEQGAVAKCNIDDDISHLITTSGSVDTSRAGTYRVTYSVTNSAGQSASVTREVRVLAPTETRLPRTPFNFTVNGKVNTTTSNTITAEESGTVTLTVTPANKTSGRVVITNGAGTEVFNQTFAGTRTENFWLDAGVYTVTGTITEGNGNTNFSMAFLMPEVLTITFAENEIPLAAFPIQANQSFPVYVIPLTAVLILLLGIIIYIENRKPQLTKPKK